MNKVVQKPKGARQAATTATWCVAQSRGDEKIRKKQKRKCLNFCNVDVRNMESKLIENDPTLLSHAANKQERHGRLARHITREEEVLHEYERAGHHNDSGLVNTHGHKHRAEGLDRRRVLMWCIGICSNETRRGRCCE